MSRIRKFLNSVLFKRILVIFVVGFILRSVVNYVYDINVFKEYCNVISLMCYGVLVCFSAYLYELPQISFNIFNIKLIRSAIKAIYEGNGFVGDKMLSGDGMFTDNITKGKGLDKDFLVVRQEESDRIGENIDGLNEKFLEESKSIHQKLNNLDKNLKESISKGKGVLTNEEIDKFNENIIKENIGKLKKEKSFRHAITDNRAYQGRNVFLSNNKDTVNLDESLRKREISKKISTRAMIRKCKKG